MRIEVANPDRGLVTAVPPHKTDLRAWRTAENVRFRFGRPEAVPNPWVAISEQRSGDVEKPQRLYHFRMADGTGFLILATDASLYRVRPDASPPDFYNIGSGIFSAGYGFPYWAEDLSDIFFVGNKVDGTFKWTGTGAAAAVAAAPKASHGCEFQSRLFLADCDVAGSDYPDRLYYSSQFDGETWDTTDDWIRCPSSSQVIRAIGKLSDDLLVVYQEQIINHVRPGVADIPFLIESVWENAGPIGHKLLASMGGRHYYLGNGPAIPGVQDGGLDFYEYDGASPPRGLGAPIRDRLFTVIDGEYIERARVMANEKHGEVWIIYPPAGSGVPSEAWVCKVGSGEWSHITGVDHSVACVRRELDIAYDDVDESISIDEMTGYPSEEMTGPGHVWLVQAATYGLFTGTWWLVLQAYDDSQPARAATLDTPLISVRNGDGRAAVSLLNEVRMWRSTEDRVKVRVQVRGGDTPSAAMSASWSQWAELDSASDDWIAYGRSTARYHQVRFAVLNGYGRTPLDGYELNLVPRGARW